MDFTQNNARQPLAPSRSSIVNAAGHGSIATTKGKGDVNEDSLDFANVFEATFVSGACPLTPETVTLTPISMILRAHLPLSWIAPYPTSDCLPQTALLKACIASVRKWDYQILIAKHANSDTLFALEKVDDNMYISLALRYCVTIEWARQAAIGAAPAVEPKNFMQPCPGQPSHIRKPSIGSVSSSRGVPTAPTSPKQVKNRRGVLARKSILEKPRDQEENDRLIVRLETLPGHSTVFREEPKLQEQPPIPLPSQQHRNDSSHLMRSMETNMSEGSPLQGGSSLPNLEFDYKNHLDPDYMRMQYLRTLYSDTPLAFFAKGHLGRTRARARTPGAPMTIQQVTLFYRESLIPGKKMDLKYKESLPATLVEYHTKATPGGDGASLQGQQSTMKRKRSRTSKLNKEGLWPTEYEHLECWWKSRELRLAKSGTRTTIEDEVARALSRLRLRETELQIILMLEILALEAGDFTTKVEANIGEMQETKLESREPGLALLTTSKRRDLNADLDILLDRLCIWHSVSVDETDAMNCQNDEDSATPNVKDWLRDFCKEIVVPFYGGKLPQQTKNICGKLGGLVTGRQHTKSTQSRSSPSVLTGPVPTAGERLNRKRPLEGVLSSSLKSYPPGTMARSSTTPINRRESSERPLSRSGLQKSVSFTNREIDLVTEARALAAKRKKLDRVALQKRELEAAIDALKKPNRAKVAQGIMDEADCRTSDTRYPTKKIRPVQISATPRHPVAKHTQLDEYDLPPIPLTELRSSSSIVPSSSLKPRGLGQHVSAARSSAKKRTVLRALQDTPSRSLASQGLDHSRSETPGQMGTTDPDDWGTNLATSTPSASRTRINGSIHADSTPLITANMQGSMLFTPVKRKATSIEAVFKDLPEMSEKASKIMDRVMSERTGGVETSIYDSLGWNDDYDLGMMRRMWR